MDRTVPPTGSETGTIVSATTAGIEAESGGDEPPLQLRGDELDLYGEFHAELWRTIRATVRAPIETIDDACSFAWMQFLRYQPDRDASWRGWLVTTAQREAWRLNAIEWRDRDFTHQEFLSNRQVDPRDRYEERIAFDAALQQLKKLPPELQRVVLIRSQVWKQEEVAEVMGIRPEQVAELLRAAAVQVAEINQERHAGERPVASPRAARLRELEQHPPEWLSKVIGSCPARSKSSAAIILAWRRAALAIDDYRRATGFDHPREAIGFAPREPADRRAYVAAERAIVRVAGERERRKGGIER